ncbi:MAG: ribose 5-phosphate isomerase A [Cenarchaeum sp. SB0675_bin_21]|nr:ribose 5-phosphate isomerase A [Cenarchaeum sp. SB0675_bin_21]
MSENKIMNVVAKDALKYVQDGMVLGLGSGRAAAVLVRNLGEKISKENICIQGVPTSLQIKLIAEEVGIKMIEPGEISKIDIVFDGADQIDESKYYLVKGGGGALLRENILANMAEQVIIMADDTKFVKDIHGPIPIEIHSAARNFVINHIKKNNGTPQIRKQERGYPIFTENGNIILDCDFGVIQEPLDLSADLRQVPGILEVGIFNKPDIIYNVSKNKFSKILIKK